MDQPLSHFTRLADTPPETHLNTVLWRLAEALGCFPEYGEPISPLDPDEVVDDAVRSIYRQRDLDG